MIFHRLACAAMALAVIGAVAPLGRTDAATNQVTARTKVGRAPNEVSITRDGRKVFVPLRNDSAIDVVDTATMKVIDRLKAPAWPQRPSLQLATKCRQPRDTSCIR